MPTPFPRMDPYLEQPALWPDVHHGLIADYFAMPSCHSSAHSITWR